MTQRQAKVFPGRVIFDHRPKTGGLAVRTWLENSLGTGCVVHVVAHSHKGLISRHGGSYSVLCAHVQYEKGGEELDPRYQYITCLRDPIDRALSWVYFAANTIPYEFSYGALGKFDVKRTAQAFIESEGAEFSPRFAAALSNVYTNHFRKVRTPAGDRAEDPVVKAFEAIKAYDVVGLHDDMPGFIDDMAAALGIPSPGEIGRKNVTKTRPAVDDAAMRLRERLKTMNQQDLRLFDMVREWKSSGAAPRPVAAPSTDWTRYDKQPDSESDGAVLGAATVASGVNVQSGQNISIGVNFHLERDVKDLVVEIRILDSSENLAFATDNLKVGRRFHGLGKGGHLATFDCVAGLPVGSYWVGARLYERESPAVMRLLGRHDRLCTFNVAHVAEHGFEGYAFLKTAISLEATNDSRKVTRDARGEIRFTQAPLRLRSHGEEKLAVRIANKSSEDWVGDVCRPISLSYHLLDKNGKPVIFDGIRTPLPGGGIPAGAAIDAMVKVATPLPPGRYRIAPSLVQENVCWFENIGLTLAAVDLEIV